MGTAAKNSPTIDAQSALAAQAALAAGQPNGAGESSGVDKMRELLFGNQMQDYDKRFSILEDRFQQRLRDLEAESTRSLGSLESTMKKQLESVAGQFREEKDLRSDADKDMQREAIGYVGFRSNAYDQLVSIYDTSKVSETRKYILGFLGMSGDPRVNQKLFSIAQSDPDPELRREAVDYLAMR